MTCRAVAETTTTTQASGPPAWLQPFLKQGADQDWNLYNTPGPGYYPGSTVANPSTATQAGNQAAVARGLNGNAAENAGTGYLTNVLNGKYLGGQNLDPVHKSIAASVSPTSMRSSAWVGATARPIMPAA